jgi:hypothetical protein
MMTERDRLYDAGVELAFKFCTVNRIPPPTITRLNPGDRFYSLGTCAFYRPTEIRVMVEKCANKGYGGRAWSWPGYTVDRTPYGVVQHELGHHVDNHFYKGRDDVFSKRIHELSKERPLTGYLGTDTRSMTFFMEWFAENFRLFVTNPDFCNFIRPKFYTALIEEGLKPVVDGAWLDMLNRHGATERIIQQAEKKINNSVAATLV